MTEDIEALKARRLDEARRRLEGTMDEVKEGQWFTHVGMTHTDDRSIVRVVSIDDDERIVFRSLGDSQHRLPLSDFASFTRLATPREVIDAYLASLPEEQRVRVTVIPYNVTFKREGRVTVDGVSVWQIRNDGWFDMRDAEHIDDMLAAARSALAKPPASKPEPKPKTRTEAIRERYAGNERARFLSDAATHSALVDGEYVVGWYGRYDKMNATDPHRSAEAIIARIDAALAKTAPAVAPDVVTPMDRLRQENASLRLQLATLVGERCNSGNVILKAETLGEALQKNTALRTQLATVTAERDELVAVLGMERESQWWQTYRAALTGIHACVVAGRYATIDSAHSDATAAADIAHGKRKAVRDGD